jgi:hypothetical protein
MLLSPKFFDPADLILTVVSRISVKWQERLEGTQQSLSSSDVRLSGQTAAMPPDVRKGFALPKALSD